MSARDEAAGGVGLLPCPYCGGDGKIWTSRYGGNDPDVWPIGNCPVCEGSGNQVCELNGCKDPAVGFDDDGNALCEDCLLEWQIDAEEEARNNGPFGVGA